MVDTQVNPVHRQYMELSSRYKAGWTFHRFIQGLRKFFGSQDLTDHTADFQELYSGLREVSKRLNDPDIQSVVERLVELQGRLEELMKILDGEDRTIAPSLVRLFFQRVKTYDDRIILDLIRFYLEVQRDRSWESDRIDKADYLLTRLAEAVGGKDTVSESSRLTRVLEGVSTHQHWPSSGDPQKVANRQKMIEAVRNEILQLERFEDLTERDLIGHYRNLKHGLGRMLFEKSILPAIVDTNLVLANRIQELSRQEEKRILEDYEKVSRLAREGEVDHDLAETVNRLHRQVSHFRKQLGSGGVRLQDVTQIRRLVLEILERMEESEELVQAAPKRDADPGARQLVLGKALGSDEERRLIGHTFEDLVAVLQRSSESTSGDRLLDTRASSYRLESRELLAFDRLSLGEECDRTLERFILVGAALRRRINDEVNEIHSYRSRIGDSKAAPLEPTVTLLGIADQYLRRFAHFVESESLAGKTAEGQHLQVLRMRLMRDFSGLWLVAHG